MLFLMDVVIIDSGSLVAKATYTVDLLRGHLVNGYSLYMTAVAAKPVCVDAPGLPLPLVGCDSQVQIPAAAWPATIRLLKKWNWKVDDKTRAIYPLFMNGKRFRISIVLKRHLVARPPQSPVQP
jgi:hypothetical protein